MSEVGAAFGTGSFGALHAIAGVIVRGDGFAFNGSVEAGPSATGFELGCRVEEGLSAAAAVIGAGAVLVPVFSGEGAFGARG